MQSSLKELWKNPDILMFNGCFDILTPGHVFFLRRCVEIAQEKNMKIYCALDSDKKIKRDKGERRPIFSFVERCNTISSLFPVIYNFYKFDSNEELENLYKTHSPTMVKGKRWSHYIVGEKWAKEIILIPDIDSYSTSEVISRIEKKTVQCIKEIFEN